MFREENDAFNKLLHLVTTTDGINPIPANIFLFGLFFAGIYFIVEIKQSALLKCNLILFPQLWARRAKHTMWNTFC